MIFRISPLNFLRVAGSLAVLLLFLSSALAGSSIGLKFAGDRSEFYPDETAGVVPQENWCSLPEAAGTMENLVDSKGNKTTAKVEWEADCLWEKGSTNQEPDERLLRGWLDGGSGGKSATVMISGIPYKSYTVYLYFSGGTDIRTVSTYKVNGQDFIVVPGSYKDGLKPAEQLPDMVLEKEKSGTYLAIPDQTGDLGIETENKGWSYDTSKDFRSPISAIQIVETAQ